MLTENLIRFADRLGWQKLDKENLAFGLYNGYPVTIVDGRNFKAFITPVAGISREGLQALNTFLTEQSRALKLRNYEFNDNFLCVRVKEPLFSLPVERMELVLEQLTGLLSEHDLPKTACVVCGEPASKRGLYFGLYAHLHAECADREPVDFTTQLEAAAAPANTPVPESTWVEEAAAEVLESADLENGSGGGSGEAVQADVESPEAGESDDR